MSILDRRAVIVVGHIYYIKQKKKKSRKHMYVFLKEKLLLFKQKR